MTAIQDVDLSALVDVVRGITFPSSAKRRAPGAGLIACLRTTNVQDTVEWHDLLFVDHGYVRSEAQLIQAGDILISMSNSLELVGKCAIVTTPPVRATFGAFIAVVRAREGIDSRYIFHVMRSPRYRAHIRGIASTTTNISNINASKLLATSVPMFGDRTRGAIVSKIDELFSRIEEGDRALERVQKLVERYRQSVLKAAVTGELTRDWREKNQGQSETGEALLARILKARREAWEADELAKMKANGIDPGNDSWKKRYVVPRAPDTTELPKLPIGWAWVSAEQICGFITKGTTPPAESMTAGTGEVPYIKVYNLTFDGSLDFSKNPTYISQQTHLHDLARSRLLPGDVVMNIVGPPLGKVSIVPSLSPEWNMNQAVAVFRPLPGCDNRFLCWYLLSRAAQDWYAKKAKATVGQINLTLDTCRSTPVPLPPYAEQLEIVQLLELEISRLSSLATSVEGDRHTAEGLRQSVLKAAFNGTLVPSDLNDEPASVLLTRISANSATAPPKPKRGPKAQSKRSI